jgi:DNA-binding response OmpR family regulator
LVSFSGDEEKLIDSVVSVLDSGREKFTFQEVQLQSEIRYKDIIIDLNHREIIRDNKKIELTYTEFEILQLLAKNPGRVLSKEQIYDVVWKESYSGDYNIVMSHISHIREKIEDDPVHNTRLFNQKV